MPELKNQSNKKSEHDRYYLTASPIKLDANGELPTRIALFVTGNWPNSIKGNFSVDLEDLKEMKEHFDKGIGFPTADASTGLAIDFMHEFQAEAGAWIKGLELDANEQDQTGTLYASPVEWTDAGEAAVRGGRFKCISPMGSFGKKNGKLSMWSDFSDLKTKLSNVLEGAGLTNIPFLRGMAPIRAAAVSDNQKDDVLFVNDEENNKEHRMNLDSLRIKAVEDLTGTEYKFLADNREQLSAEEQTKFSLVVAEKVEGEQLSTEDRATLDAIKAGSKKVVDANTEVIEKTRLDALESTVSEYKEEKAKTVLDKHVARGAIKQDATEYWTKQLLSVDGEDRKALETQLEALPSNEMLAKEIGSGEDTNAGSTAREQLHSIANQKIAAAAKEGKELLYSDALKLAARENADLQAQDLKEQGVK
jgi:hypothetical protein